MMVALPASPPTPAFSSIGWPLLLEEEPLNLKDKETSDEYSFPRRHHPPPQVEVDTCTSSPSNTNTVKTDKFHHNANERDRRKKINTLYSSLRSLLPDLPQRQMKKVSIPATISMVVKYIPEVEQEVEGLVKKKEELLLRISGGGREAAAAASSLNTESPMKFGHRNSNCVVSTSRLNDCEAVVQISSYEIHNIPLSHVLLSLEQDHHQYTLSLLNASSFHTFEGRVFHHLHFQVGKCCRLEWDEIITEKLLCIYEKKA